MGETLFYTYAPLIVWIGLGFFTCRLLNDSLPRFLGRALYWVGVPLQILALTRRTDFSPNLGVAPLVTMSAFLVGLGLVWCCWHILSYHPSQDRPTQGSFFLSSLLGNTGFVGLAIAPYLVAPEAYSLVIFYSVTNNIIGTYGVGVFLASYFGRSNSKGWSSQLRDVLSVPSLWAFVFAYATHDLSFAPVLESALQGSLWVVVPLALSLMGMRLSQIKNWESFRFALIPATLRVVVIPGLVFVGTMAFGLTSDERLALVLMSGMPTAFAALILAEEYELDRTSIACSIVVSTLLLLLVIPVWLLLLPKMSLHPDITSFLGTNCQDLIT